MATDITTNLAGEQLVLLPERALYWPRRAMLIVADLHWGKAATFRAAGIPIPEGGTGDDLARLDQALRRAGARRLMLLGDLLHARSGRADALLAQIAAWRARWPDLEVTLVRGNHDRGAGDPPSEWRFTCVNEPFPVAPFVFRHHPHDSSDGYVLAGHLHPAVQLRGAGRQHMRLACFWFGAHLGILPAFGSFTGISVVSPAVDDRVFAIPGDQVVAIQ
jgi:DNA ligase-associated metallophosphoesterase